MDLGFGVVHKNIYIFTAKQVPFSLEMFSMEVFVSSLVFIFRAGLPVWLFCKCVRCVSLVPLWGSEKT